MSLRDEILSYVANAGEATAHEVVQAVESTYDDEPDDVLPPARGTIKTTITQLRQMGLLDIEPDCVCRSCGISRAVYRITAAGRQKIKGRKAP